MMKRKITGIQNIHAEPTWPHAKISISSPGIRTVKSQENRGIVWKILCRREVIFQLKEFIHPHKM